MYMMDVFCSCYAVTSAITQLHYYASNLLTSACKHTKHMNDSFAIINLLSQYTRATDSTEAGRPLYYL